ncbi:MAG TPA: VCBS repeat-containing protein, partial [Polyangiaceae bacterium]|nr:VCBS repeat-containing protein [Polyangiaceae bacterium]
MFVGVVLAAVPVFLGLVLAAVPVFMGCAAGVEATSAGRAGTPPPVVALAPAPASAAASALGAASTAPVAAPPAPELAWLSARGAGPLCAAQAQAARRRLEAIGRAFGAEYFNARFARREERNEAFFCREEASVAWSVSVAGLDGESAPPCSPEADQACAERAALATRAAVRAVEAGQEARTCWSARHTDPAPCDEAGEAGSFQGVGELLHDRAHGWLPHVQLADVDADGRPELVFLYRDNSGLREHSWYVALRAAGPGLPIEQHPAFLRPSVVGFVDVDRDGRRDLLTRA